MVKKLNQLKGIPTHPVLLNADSPNYPWVTCSENVMLHAPCTLKIFFVAIEKE